MQLNGITLTKFRLRVISSPNSSVREDRIASHEPSSLFAVGCPVRSPFRPRLLFVNISDRHLLTPS